MNLLPAVLLSSFRGCRIITGTTLPLSGWIISLWTKHKVGLSTLVRLSALRGICTITELMSINWGLTPWRKNGFIPKYRAWEVIYFTFLLFWTACNPLLLLWFSASVTYYYLSDIYTISDCQCVQSLMLFSNNLQLSCSLDSASGTNILKFPNWCASHCLTDFSLLSVCFFTQRFCIVLQERKNFRDQKKSPLSNFFRHFSEVRIIFSNLTLTVECLKEDNITQVINH